MLKKEQIKNVWKVTKIRFVESSTNGAIWYYSNDKNVSINHFIPIELLNISWTSKNIDNDQSSGYKLKHFAKDEMATNVVKRCYRTITL